MKHEDYNWYEVKSKSMQDFCKFLECNHNNLSDVYGFMNNCSRVWLSTNLSTIEQLISNKRSQLIAIPDFKPCINKIFHFSNGKWFYTDLSLKVQVHKKIEVGQVWKDKNGIHNVIIKEKKDSNFIAFKDNFIYPVNKFGKSQYISLGIELVELIESFEFVELVELVEPKVGDFGAFWDMDNPEKLFYARLDKIDHEATWNKYVSNIGEWGYEVFVPLRSEYFSNLVYWMLKNE